MHGLDYSVPLFHTRARGTHIVVTPDIVSEVLHVLRVEHPNYPSYKRLKTMSKDELIYAFCGRPSDWVIFSLLYVRPLLKVLDS